ncbi:hypothetical protein [Streptomyces sp. NPDC056255]|uniref:hypothetical protein n=1 Tax=Streptomyces sp. NPDC056255 TaxID=3345764 RepID=UPI0035DD3E1E
MRRNRSPTKLGHRIRQSHAHTLETRYGRSATRGTDSESNAGLEERESARTELAVRHPAARCPPSRQRTELVPLPQFESINILEGTYSLDAATEQVTVSWDPKDPADTVTTGYRKGYCSGPSTVDKPCFARVSGLLLTGGSFTFQQAAGRTRYFRLYAENATHQLTGSVILTITT